MSATSLPISTTAPFVATTTPPKDLEERLKDTEYALKPFERWELLVFLVWIPLMLVLARFGFRTLLKIHKGSTADLRTELIEKDNKAVCLSFAGYVFAVGLTTYGALSNQNKDSLTTMWQAMVWSMVGFALVNLSEVINDKLLHFRINYFDEVIDNANIAVGIVHAAVYVSSGIIVRFVISGYVQEWGWALLSTVILWAATQVFFILIVHLYDLVTPKVDIQEELLNDNRAVGVSVAGGMLSFAVLVQSPIAKSESVVALAIWCGLGLVCMVMYKFISNTVLISNKLIVTPHSLPCWAASLVESACLMSFAMAMGNFITQFRCGKDPRPWKDRITDVDFAMSIFEWYNLAFLACIFLILLLARAFSQIYDLAFAFRYGAPKLMVIARFLRVRRRDEVKAIESQINADPYLRAKCGVSVQGPLSIVDAMPSQNADGENTLIAVSSTVLISSNSAAQPPLVKNTTTTTAGNGNGNQDYDYNGNYSDDENNKAAEMHDIPSGIPSQTDNSLAHLVANDGDGNGGGGGKGKGRGRGSGRRNNSVPITAEESAMFAVNESREREKEGNEANFDAQGNPIVAFPQRQVYSIAQCIQFSGYLIGIAFVMRGALGASVNPSLYVGDVIAYFFAWSAIGLFGLAIGFILVRYVLWRALFEESRENTSIGVLAFGAHVASGMIMGSCLGGMSFADGSLNYSTSNLNPNENADYKWGEDIATVAIFFGIGQGLLLLTGFVFQFITKYNDIAEVRRENTAVGLTGCLNWIAFGVCASAPVFNSDSVLNVFLFYIIAVILLQLIRLVSSYVIVGGGRLDNEIAVDCNWGASFIEGAASITTALCLTTFVSDTCVANNIESYGY